ncbi:MAG: hypothetical protein ACHQ50_12920, partial [Fimbriimonadales bacterium]
MDEPTPPLAAYPGPKNPRPPRDADSAGAQRGVFLLVGVTIGAAIVIATLQFATPSDKVPSRAATPPATLNNAQPGAPTAPGAQTDLGPTPADKPKPA